MSAEQRHGTGPATKGLAARAQGLIRTVDREQQSRAWLAIAVGTAKKFSDDQARNLGALIAYYAFASVFPLLLVAYSILDIISRNNAKLGQRLTTALNQYPVIGTHLGETASQGLGKTGLALVIGILLTLYGARGIATAMQNAMNTVWGVPKFRRPRSSQALLRSLGLIALLGPGEIITIALSSIAGGIGHVGGALPKIAAAVVSLLLNFALFWVGFRIATAKEIATRDMRQSAVLAAVAWQILQVIGGTIILHTTNSAYGAFGIVLGLLAFLYVQAQITLSVVELGVVRSRRLWPRSLAPPLRDADLRAYQMSAAAGQRSPEVEIEVRPAPQRATGDGRPERQ
jgi:membrane protein